MIYLITELFYNRNPSLIISKGQRFWDYLSNLTGLKLFAGQNTKMDIDQEIELELEMMREIEQQNTLDQPSIFADSMLFNSANFAEPSSEQSNLRPFSDNDPLIVPSVYKSDELEVANDGTLIGTRFMTENHESFSSLKRVSDPSLDPPSKRNRYPHHELHDPKNHIPDLVIGTQNDCAESKKNYDYTTIPKGDFVISTGNTGSRVYFPKKKRFLPIKTQSCNILTVSIYDLIKSIQDESKEVQGESNENVRVWSGNAENSQLWVDKYRPKHYVDLVGDERLHRDTLSWIKNWDFAVFRRDVKRPFHVWKPLHQKGEHEYTTPADKYQRPEKRIMLLAGPPGLGKTTLAHVLAEHCGYRVVEINARFIMDKL